MKTGVSQSILNTYLNNLKDLNIFLLNKISCIYLSLEMFVLNL